MNRLLTAIAVVCLLLFCLVATACGEKRPCPRGQEFREEAVAIDDNFLYKGKTLQGQRLFAKGCVGQDDEGSYRRLGRWRFFYQNGVLFAEGRFDGGVLGMPPRFLRTVPLADDFSEFRRDIERGREGPWVEWYENGQKWSEGSYRNGKEEGPWVEWYENGQKRSESSFRNGKKEGPSVRWYENGRKSSEGSFRNGSMEGLWVEWHENGRKSSEGSFRNGKHEGPWVGWHENGQRAYEGSYHNGKREGPWVEWYENGQKRYTFSFRNGEAEGPGVAWHENGQRAYEGSYHNGKREGPSVWWFENGTLNTEETGTYRAGLKVAD